MPMTAEGTLVFEKLEVRGYEKVFKIVEEQSGLKAIICLHDTTLGPGLGGTRIHPYATFEEALFDVKRLSRGMTYKSAIAEVGFGGAKSVIIADPKSQKTPELLRAFGRAVDSLEGEYICAEDVGSTTADMRIIREMTPYVVGLEHENSSGDPSPYTAWGTFRGIQVTLKKLYGSDCLRHRTIALQGLGFVGSKLLEYLFWAGANVIIADIDQKKVDKFAKHYGVKSCSANAIYDVECDLFSPCAMGAVLNPNTIPRLRCKAIAGSANNQLLSDADADALKQRGILYAPDFVVNAGGLINVAQELEEGGYQPQRSHQKVHNLYEKLLLVYDIAEQNQFSTNSAAMALGDYRLKYKIGRRILPPQYPHYFS